MIAQPTPPRAERRLFALGLRLFAATCLSIMTILIKLAAEHGVSTPEMIFWRQAFALPVVIGFVFFAGGFAVLRTNRLRLHMTRSAVGLTAMAFTFSSYALLPLAEATTLGFTVPIFATILAALILKERTGVHRWGAVIIGFVGVLIMVQPSGSAIPFWGAVIGLASAFMIACASLLIRQMARTENPASIVFYFTVLSLPLLAPFLIWFGQWHDTTGWLLMLGIGLIGGFAQLALTASLRWAPVSVVIAVDYIALLWSTLGDWYVWGHIPPAATWAGAPLIIGGGLYIAWREHRLRLERAKDISL